MDQIKGGVTAAKGFHAGGRSSAGSNIRIGWTWRLLYSKNPCAVAGTFTTNIVKAAPVKWDQRVVYETNRRRRSSSMRGSPTPVRDRRAWSIVARRRRKRAVLKCAGGSGACGVHRSDRYAASHRAHLRGDRRACGRAYGGLGGRTRGGAGDHDDRHPSEGGGCHGGARRQDGDSRRDVQGVWHDPSEYVYDAELCHNGRSDYAEALQEALRADVEDTYNMVSVDGDTSTNDTCLLLANGMAENSLIAEKNEDTGHSARRSTASTRRWRR